MTDAVRDTHVNAARAPMSAHRPRVLMLAYYFPPVSKIGGIRAFNMAKSLSDRGWDVTVVSPAVSMWRSVERADDFAVELDRRAIRCIRTGHDWRNLSPGDLACRDRGLAWVWGGICRRTSRALGIESQVGWYRETAKACAALSPGDADVVVATGPPFVSFRLAAEIATQLGCPYVLDYRDLWTHNPHVKRSTRSSASSAEGRLLDRAMAVTVVSQQLAVSLREEFGVGDRVSVVTNGYDPEDLFRVTPEGFGHFAIVYTGQFYPPKRVIDPLLAALALMKRSTESRRQWRFHYYGPHGTHVQAAMARYGLKREVVVHGNVARSEALAAVAGAGVCVVITSVSETGSREDLGIVTGKVFEAIGLRRPVVAIAPPGSDLEIVLKTSGLGERFSGTEIEPLARFLGELVNGRTVSPHAPERYSWPEIGEKVHHVLRDVVRRAPLASPGAGDKPLPDSPKAVS